MDPLRRDESVGHAAVTFDLWHTLIYLEPADEEAYMRSQLALAVDVLRSAAVRPGAPSLPVERLREAFAAEYARAVALAQQGTSVTPGAQLERAAAATGRDVAPQEYLDRLAALVARTPFRLASGAKETVGSLRDAGLRTAIISNTTGEPGSSIRPALRAFGLDELFDAVIFSDERPWSKPSPQIFQDALSALGAPAGRAVHVGDGWADIEGARRAGFCGGILFTGLQNYGEEYRRLFSLKGRAETLTPYRTDRLSEVPDIVARLLGAGA